MNPLERLRRLHEEAFVRGQAMVSQTQAAEEFSENQAAAREAAKAALETINLANELAADNDPHKRRLAALIKDYAVGGAQEVAKGPLPADDGRAIESHPFSVGSSNSGTSLGTSLPDTTKSLPPTPPPSSPPARRGRGRPRKQPQG